MMAAILLICSGNTCRSPMAEALLRDKILTASEAVAEWNISSAGMYAVDGSIATLESREVMAERGLDLSSHQSRRLDESMAAGSDLMITMEGWHRDQLRERFPQCRERIFSLSELAGCEGEDVIDPYGGRAEVYRQTAEQIQKLIDRAWGIIMAMFALP